MVWLGLKIKNRFHINWHSRGDLHTTVLTGSTLGLLGIIYV